MLLHRLGRALFSNIFSIRMIDSCVKVWLTLICLLFLFSSLYDNIFTLFLRSSLICFLISYLLSYFSFFALAFSSLALSIATTLFYSTFFYLSLIICFFCSCFSSCFALSYFERYLLIIGFNRIASMEGLFFWSTWSICKIKLLRSFEYWAGIGGNDPLRIFKAKTGKELASNGSFRAQSWYSITPKAHISALVEYDFPSTISGLR